MTYTAILDNGMSSYGSWFHAGPVMKNHALVSLYRHLTYTSVER